MVIGDWSTFYQSLAIELNGGRAVPKPTNAALDDYERRIGRRLPRSYREFITVFGPGEFSCTLRIAAPGYRYLRTDFDIDFVNEGGYGYAEEEMERYQVLPESRSLLRRLWWFGFGGSRHWMGWDPEDARDPANAEYAIYAVGSICDIELVATSFRQLVADTCEVLFAPDPNWCEEELGPQRSFDPAVTYDRGSQDAEPLASPGCTVMVHLSTARTDCHGRLDSFSSEGKGC